MPVTQWCEIFEHAARDTITGAETTYPLPLKGTLRPEFNPTDAARVEFRGQSTHQGATNVYRQTEQWSFTSDSYWYPIRAIGILLKHAFGKAVTRVVTDTTAYKGITYTIDDPFISTELDDKAVGVLVNYNAGAGVTKSRKYYGGRITAMTVTFSADDSVGVQFTIQGPGEQVTSEAAATTEPDFSTLPSPFDSCDALFYIGAGISRTGTAPDFTAIAAGSMAQFSPDSATIEFNFGRTDKTVMNGICGPSKTSNSEQMSVTFNGPIDYEDPASGFSSHDEVEALLSDVKENSILVVITSDEVAGSTTEPYSAAIDLPALFLQPTNPEFNAEGNTPSATLAYNSLYSDTAEYTASVLTVDKETTY